MNYFPLQPKQCFKCGKHYLVAVDPAYPPFPGEKDESGVCWYCMHLPHLIELKKLTDESLRELRPKRWLSLLRAGIAAG